MKGKISFIGSGNVAFNLARAFDLSGYQIHQVISRNEQTGKELSGKYAAFFDKDISALMADADFVFLCLPDKTIGSIAAQLKTKGPIIMHCAGSCSLKTISDHVNPAAVFYPLQTFTKDRQADFNKIPILIEAIDFKTYQAVRDLAFSISNRVVELDSEKRLYLHLAAVIANNFTNHLLAQSEKILKLQQLPFDLLKPLVEETVKKAFEGSPSKNQTGPAVRNDQTTIQKHLEMLREDENLKMLYQMISDNITTETKPV
jgi:predicted short-subunit dehydrogenase-like oxidoreductase (DUF2520 family)